jgi:predicted RNA binding protein YcfA (HicA-like mRNA interferase family)
LKTPRDVSSDRLIRHLVRNWGYTVERQSGSHILLQGHTPVRHTIPIPQRNAIGLGLFRDILNQISVAKGVSVAEILRDL